MVGILHQQKIKTDSHVVDQIRADRQEIASFTENVVVSDVIRRTKNKRGDSHLGKTFKIMTNLSSWLQKCYFWSLSKFVLIKANSWSTLGDFSLIPMEIREVSFKMLCQWLFLVIVARVLLNQCWLWTVQDIESGQMNQFCWPTWRRLKKESVWSCFSNHLGCSPSKTMRRYWIFHSIS